MGKANQAVAELTKSVADTVGKTAAEDITQEKVDDSIPKVADIVKAARTAREKVKAKAKAVATGQNSQASADLEIKKQNAKQAVAEWEASQQAAEQVAEEKERMSDQQLAIARKQAHAEVARAKKHAAKLEAMAASREHVSKM